MAQVEYITIKNASRKVIRNSGFRPVFLFHENVEIHEGHFF